MNYCMCGPKDEKRIDSAIRAGRGRWPAGQRLRKGRERGQRAERAERVSRAARVGAARESRSLPFAAVRPRHTPTHSRMHTHNGPEHAPAPPHKHFPNRLKHGDSPAQALDVLLQPARPQCLVHIAAQRPPPRADQTTHAPANGPGAPCRILVLGRVTVLATALVTETSTPCPAFLLYFPG